MRKFPLAICGKVRILVRMEEILRQHLALCAAAYQRAAGVTPASIGKRALNDNTFFARCVEGASGFTIRTYDRVLAWLSENWPDDTEWPPQVPRPDPSPNITDSSRLAAPPQTEAA